MPLTEVEWLPMEYSTVTFAPHAGESFDLDLDESGRGPIAIELVEVSELPSPPRMEAFTLLFRGPPRVSLAQRVYRMRHSALGQLSVFLVPVGRDRSGRPLYEAVFQRLREP